MVRKGNLDDKDLRKITFSIYLVLTFTECRLYKSMEQHYDL
jgi:hypothetical protein